MRQNGWRNEKREQVFPPAWRQLEDLAYRDYHRATALFFWDDPLPETTISAEFRRLPGSTLEDLRPDTLYAIRPARIRQGDLAALVGARGAGEKYIRRDLRGRADASNPARLASAVREDLDVSLDEQKSWSRAGDALKRWRQHIEDAGVWVFKMSFRQKDVAGFCLNDDTFPVICLNNG